MYFTQFVPSPTQVPMDAIYRVGLALQPAWNAVVGAARNGPALHVFGVAADTCPPGTYLKTAPRTEARLAPPSNDSRLSDLYLLQRGGSAIELSTQFQSNTTLYGAMVAPVRTPHPGAQPCCNCICMIAHTCHPVSGCCFVVSTIVRIRLH